MDRDGYQKIPRSFRKYGWKSFHDISVSKDGKKQTFCVADSYVADLLAVDFDAVKNGLYASMARQCDGHCPRSVDALYMSGRNVYAVEFKTGKVKPLDLVRKLYDTVMCFIEHDRRDFKWSRSRMVAVVVASKGVVEKDRDSLKTKMPKAQRVFSRAGFYQVKPGIGEGRVQSWGLGKLEGVLVSRVYTLSPDEFNSFAERNEWE